MRLFVYIIVSKIFPVTLKIFFNDRIVRSSAKAALVSLMVELTCIPSAAKSFLHAPAGSVELSTQIFLVDSFL